MYAKSIIEYVQWRAVSGAWSRHLSFVPVAMALMVAISPFTLSPRRAEIHPVPLAAVEQAAPVGENPFHGLVHASVSVALKRAQPPLDNQQRTIANHIKRKYGVSTEVVQDLVRTAYMAGKRYSVDPLLVVAVMAVESSYNPIAESWAGAKGLMQIIPRYHLEKFAEFGGEASVYDPRVNIMVGARILREYLLMHSGDLLAALQFYAGATADTEAIYTERVLNEKDQLNTLLGLPKAERKPRVVAAKDGVAPKTAPTPVLEKTPSTESTMAPAPTGSAPLPATPAQTTRPGDEAGQAPPAQAQPQAAPPMV